MILYTYTALLHVQCVLYIIYYCHLYRYLTAEWKHKHNDKEEKDFSAFRVLSQSKLKVMLKGPFFKVNNMLKKNSLAVKKVRGQSEAKMVINNQNSDIK